MDQTQLIIEELQQKVDSLSATVRELETWKEEKERQQISYPLDLESKEVIAKDFLKSERLLTYYGGASGNVFNTLLTKVDDKVYGINVTKSLMNFTVNTTTNVIYPAEPYYLEADMVVYFYSTDTLPGGLDSAVDYYVINPTASSFQVSLSVGGAAVDITTTGAGSHYVETLGTF